MTKILFFPVLIAFGAGMNFANALKLGDTWFMMVNIMAVLIVWNMADEKFYENKRKGDHQ